MLRLRTVRATDWARLYYLRNHEETRRWLARGEPIPLTEHLEWFTRVVADPTTTLMVIEESDGFMGYVRLDEQPPEHRAKKRGQPEVDPVRVAEVSVAVVPWRHGRGIASTAISHATETALSLGITKLLARIKADNGRSVCAFVAAGYTLASYDATWIHLERTFKEPAL